MMKSKTMMKMIGITLAVCSAITMMQGKKMSSSSAKKAIKKTANKVAGIVDTLSNFM